MRQGWLTRIRQNSRRGSRRHRINHGKILARTRFYTRAARSESEGAKTFPLKNAFAYVDGIAWLDAKASSAAFCEPLRIDLENLIACRRGMSPHGHSLRAAMRVYPPAIAMASSRSIPPGLLSGIS